jgi:D-3-phosphoglycerate dehydrogenase
VLITEPITEVGLKLLEPSCDLFTPWRERRSFNEEELASADGLIVRLVPVDAALISRAPNLKVVGRHGVGLDSVDLAAASARGIAVVYTPRVNANSVAEHAVNLLLALARHTVRADATTRTNRFDLRGQLVGMELRHKVLGIVGMGAVGTRLAEICSRGFGMKVVAFDPCLTARPLEPAVTYVNTLEDLLRQADVVSLHLPLTEETRHLINARTLGLMKPSALLINTARGSVVDTQALAAALEANQIQGAALDVFEDEPLPAGHPILSAPRTVLTPHIASSTRDAMDAMAYEVALQVLQVLRGERPASLANAEAVSGRLL